jgi:hypothetical protein
MGGISKELFNEVSCPNQVNTAEKWHVPSNLNVAIDASRLEKLQCGWRERTSKPRRGTTRGPRLPRLSAAFQLAAPQR